MKLTTTSFRVYFFRLIALVIVCIVLTMLILFRYRQLKTRVDVTDFFNHAAYTLSRLIPGELIEQPTPVPESVRQKAGNQFPALRAGLPNVIDKYLSDPFCEQNGTFGWLDLRYGTVRHALAIRNPLIDPDGPRWFVHSFGPARIPAEIQAALGENGVYQHQFLTLPYDCTNGLWSVGYLFMDSKGVIWGEIR